MDENMTNLELKAIIELIIKIVEKSKDKEEIIKELKDLSIMNDKN